MGDRGWLMGDDRVKYRKPRASTEVDMLYHPRTGVSRRYGGGGSRRASEEEDDPGDISPTDSLASEPAVRTYRSKERGYRKKTDTTDYSRGSRYGGGPSSTMAGDDTSYMFDMDHYSSGRKHPKSKVKITRSAKNSDELDERTARLARVRDVRRKSGGGVGSTSGSGGGGSGLSSSSRARPKSIQVSGSSRAKRTGSRRPGGYDDYSKPSFRVTSKMVRASSKTDTSAPKAFSGPKTLPRSATSKQLGRSVSPVRGRDKPSSTRSTDRTMFHMRRSSSYEDLTRRAVVVSPATGGMSKESGLGMSGMSGPRGSGGASGLGDALEPKLPEIESDFCSSSDEYTVEQPGHGYEDLRPKWSVKSERSSGDASTGAATLSSSAVSPYSRVPRAFSGQIGVSTDRFGRSATGLTGIPSARSLSTTGGPGGFGTGVSSSLKFSRGGTGAGGTGSTLTAASARMAKSKRSRSSKRKSAWLPDDMFNNITTSLGQMSSTELGSRMPNAVIFDLLDQTRWQLDTLLEIPSFEDFMMYVGDDSTTSRRDLLRLAWDLLRTNEKCGELLHMVTSMNQHLENESLAFEHMMESTIVSLECQFASLYVFDEETSTLSCFCTSEDTSVDATEFSFQFEPKKRRRRARYFCEKVFKSEHHITLDMTADDLRQTCPETYVAHLAGDCISVLGVPVKDVTGSIIAVLVAYRDLTRFTENEVKSATILTGIASNTLRNLQTFSLARRQKRESEEIVDIIDEMSADIHEASYHSTIKKLLRKIRTLIFCQKLDFWTISGTTGNKRLTCEISSNGKYERTSIPVNRSHVLGQVATAGRPKKIDSAQASSYTAEELRYSRGQSILVIPVVLTETSSPIAVIQAINKIPQNNHGASKLRGKKSMDRVVPFTKKDQRLLETLSKSASVIIRNSEMFNRIHGQKRKNMALVQILKVLQQKHDVNTMVHNALDCILVALDCERCSLWFESGDGTLSHVETMATKDDSRNDDDMEQIFVTLANFCANVNDFINTLSVLNDEDLMRKVAEFDPKICNVFDSLNHLRKPTDVYRLDSSSVLCFPIAVENSSDVVGVILAAYQKQKAPFSNTDEDILSAIASEVAHTIERNISQWTMQLLANDDEAPLDVVTYFLTGSHDQQVEDIPGVTDDDEFDDDDLDDGVLDPLADGSSSDEDLMDSDSDLSVGKSGSGMVGGGSVTALASGRRGGSSGSGHLHDSMDAKKLAKMKERRLRKARKRRRSMTLSIADIRLSHHLEKELPILQTCDFDTTSYRHDDLEQLVVFVYNDLGLIRDFNLDLSKLKLFVKSVRNEYYENPFHNWEHGFSVMQWVYVLLKSQLELHSVLKRLDVLSMVTAGLCHDIGHPGNDNYFEAESESPLAQIYNGESVLENHHAHLTLNLLRVPETNFMCNIPTAQLKDVKKTIVKSILTTDMMHHTESIEWLHNLSNERAIEQLKRANEIENSNKNGDSKKDGSGGSGSGGSGGGSGGSSSADGSSGSGSGDSSSKTDASDSTPAPAAAPPQKILKESERKAMTLKICQCIVHLGDLSAQTYPWSIAKIWEERIAHEFYEQTREEANLGIPVREWMTKIDIVSRYKSQYFFIEHVVKPLWQPARQLLPTCEARLAQLTLNGKKFLEESNKASEAQKAKEEAKGAEV